MSPSKKAAVPALSLAVATCSLLWVTGCASAPIACAGQCSPPYQLSVIFRPHTTAQVARSELSQCSRGDRNVIRIGYLQSVNGQFQGTVYTHYIPKPRVDKLQKCLAAEPHVLNAGWAM